MPYNERYSSPQGTTLTARIFLKLIVGVACVLIVALASVDVLVSRMAADHYLESRTRELFEKTRMLADLSGDGFAELAPEEFRALARHSGSRVTVVARDGVVLADSEADPLHMDNHAARPELAEALAGREGSITRVSPTVGIQFLYVAVPIEVGALRLAVPLSDIEAQVTALRKEMLTSILLAFIPAMLVAAFFARYVSARLGRIIEYAGRLADGGFRKRLGAHGKDELGLLATKMDETAEKLENTFDQLRQEHEDLERAERARKDFVINVSHELRTPLASIQGYTETLINGAIHDPAHNLQFLNIIRQNAERLGNLTSDLLTLSRIELKLQKFQFASYYVTGLIEDCVESLKPLADRKRIRIRVEPAPEGAEAFCDSEAVHQALSNLLDNAIKYSPEDGEITVTARAVRPDQGGTEFVEISVRDTGQGISKEEWPRLFERFYRVDKARSRELGGTGLGLAIVKHLVRAQGGTVRVESEPGKGAMFAFTLPVEDLGLKEEPDVKPELTVS